MDKDLIELKLYSKNPIYVGNVPITYVSLSKIAETGQGRFNSMLSLICSTLDDIPGIDLDKNITYFDVLFASAVEDATMKQSIYDAFELFTGERPTVNLRNESFIFPSGFSITKENFGDVVEVIKIRNGLAGKDDDNFNPADEKTKEIIERMKQLRKKVEKVRKNTGSITLGELVSALASGLQLSVEEVMGYDLYIFNDQLNRMRLFKDYDTGVQALVHGAKAEDVKLKHWLSNPASDDDEDEEYDE